MTDNFLFPGHYVIIVNYDSDEKVPPGSSKNCFLTLMNWLFQMTETFQFHISKALCNECKYDSDEKVPPGSCNKYTIFLRKIHVLQLNQLNTNPYTIMPVCSLITILGLHLSRYELCSNFPIIPMLRLLLHLHLLFPFPGLPSACLESWDTDDLLKHQKRKPK